ncbi:MAG: hypothetical protein ING91_19340 [Rhodocyclaceae bacterium]|nr:hypothetical protein [Rhodocyclaceae bacterium]MCA3116389.1 hypothetical protein [Rhodocyclaceae bacterium]MCA3127064.1 hypothetical protein [Rhodocyclaceae bacterium]
MSALELFEREWARSREILAIDIAVNLRRIKRDIELQFQAARAEVHGFSYQRSLGQLRRFHQLNRRT